MMRREKITRTDIVLAVKVICLFIQAGLPLPDPEFIKRSKVLNVMGLVLGHVSDKEFIIDTHTKSLIIHLTNYFQNVKDTGSSVTAALEPILRGEWSKVKKPHIHVRFGFRNANLYINAYIDPETALQKSFASSDIDTLKKEIKLHYRAWDYYPLLRECGADVTEYFRFLAGEESF